MIKDKWSLDKVITRVKIQFGFGCDEEEECRMSIGNPIKKAQAFTRAYYIMMLRILLLRSDFFFYTCNHMIH